MIIGADQVPFPVGSMEHWYCVHAPLPRGMLVCGWHCRRDVPFTSSDCKRVIFIGLQSMAVAAEPYSGAPVAVLLH